MSSNKESALIHLYHTMRDHLQDAINENRDQLPSLKQLINDAKEKISDLDELTREEIEQIGEYLERDLEAAGSYLAETGEDLGRWFHMEETLIEDRLKDLFAQIADPTQIALTRLSAAARHAQNYHSGEVVGMGKLECVQCGNTIQIDETSVIPECPECKGTTFKIHHTSHEQKQ